MSSVFPAVGNSASAVKAEADALLKQDRSFRETAFNISWPVPPDDVLRLALDVQEKFGNLNAFFTSSSPALTHADAELCAMVREILGGSDDARTQITVGGTESTYLGVKTARDKFRATRAAQGKLNMVLPYTAHPSFDKHAQAMDLEVRRVPVQANWEADADAMNAVADENTFLLVGSAPSYTHGVLDPIASLGQVALKRNIWLHVDACVGGFLLPFIKTRNGLKDFDLSVPGVRSVSADLHKFGYCLNGISSFTLVDRADLPYQSYQVDNAWPQGRYMRTTFVGSRSGNVVGAAWAVFKYLGRAGFDRIANRIATLADELGAGLGAIDGLRLNAEPRCGIVSCAVADDIPIASLIAAIEELGFFPGRSMDPPSLHFLLDPMEDNTVVPDYISAVERAVRKVRSGMSRRVEDKGVVYGA